MGRMCRDTEGFGFRVWRSVTPKPWMFRVKGYIGIMEKKM